MSVASPPPFENKNNCYRCNTTFGVLTRKHHCRNCGKTVCGNCSPKSAPLPQFAISESVRVCDPCYSAVTNKTGATAASSSSNGTSTPTATAAAPATATASATTTTSSAPASSPPIKRAAPAPTFTPFSGFGGAKPAAAVYDLKGDLNGQCRDAIKAGDIAGVTTLLNAGAEPTFRDHTGNTLLHLAAMFNRADMCSELIKRGADVNDKNPSNETPLDLAPPALQHKMKDMTASKS